MQPKLMETILLRIKSLFDGLQIKTIAGATAATLVEIIGENIIAYEILFILVLIDTVTGVMKGVKNRNLSSTGFKATTHKLILYFLLVISAHQLTRLQPSVEWIEQFIVFFLAATEMLSIIENCHVLGIVIPDWVSEKLKDYLKRDKMIYDRGEVSKMLEEAKEEGRKEAQNNINNPKTYE